MGTMFALIRYPKDSMALGESCHKEHKRNKYYDNFIGFYFGKRNVLVDEGIS